MALKVNSTYNPKYFFRSKHFNTVYRTLFHNFTIDYKRKRIELQDGDFIDLDFSSVKSNEIVIVLHGVEGSANSNYVKSVTHVLNKNNYDVVAVNFRGCSGEPNRLLSSYHSGKTDDIINVVQFLEENYNYKSYNLIGFSLGGNVTLKYLGEMGELISSKIKSAATVSVPCDLKGSSESIAKFWNVVYMQRFLISLKKKTHIKLKQFPESFLDKEKIDKVKNFYDFDNMYTAPAHGFTSAFDYWEKSSSKKFIESIKVPTLLITADDDPFLSSSCIPVEEANNNKNFLLEITKHGGHVGFNSNFSQSSGLWLENRIVEFFQDHK